MPMDQVPFHNVASSAVSSFTGYSYQFYSSSGVPSFKDASGVARLIGGNVVTQTTVDSTAVTTTTLADQITITLPFVGSYIFELYGVLTSVGTVVIPGLQFNGTSTPSAWRWLGSVGGNGVIPVAASTGTTAYSATAVSGQSLATAGSYGISLCGTLTITAVGTLKAQLSKVSGGTSIQLRSGSMLVARQMA